MPGPGCVCGYAIAAGREVDPVAAHEPPRGRVELDLARRERALVVALELPDERVPVDLRRAEVRLVARRRRRRRGCRRPSRRRPDARRARVSMEVLAAVDHDRLAGDEVGVGPAR